MTNIVPWPRTGNPQNRSAAHERLVKPLNERVALQNFAAKRQQYYANPNTETEAAMLAARDAWDVTYQAANGGGR